MLPFYCLDVKCKLSWMLSLLDAC